MNISDYTFLSWFALLIIFIASCSYYLRHDLLNLFSIKKTGFKVFKKTYSEGELKQRWELISSELKKHPLDENTWKDILEENRATLAVLQNKIKIIEMIGKKEEFNLNMVRKNAFQSFYIWDKSKNRQMNIKIFESVEEIANLSAMAGKDIDETNDQLLH